VFTQIDFEKKNIIETARQLDRAISPDERKRLAHLSITRIEQHLDRGAGACLLRKPPLAKMVSEALLQFDEKRYRLFSRCVMPNHVHVVARLFPGSNLASVLHSWKFFTAKEARRVTIFQGSLWQREYYDHLLRNEVEFDRANQYVTQNPIKAGLKDWPWIWLRGQDALATAGGTPALPSQR
jgi:REP element-mobilizing transposase RayT